MEKYVCWCCGESYYNKEWVKSVKGYIQHENGEWEEQDSWYCKKCELKKLKDIEKEIIKCVEEIIEEEEQGQ